MGLPFNLRVVIENSLGVVEAATSVGGGDVNEAAKFQTRQGVFFVKWNLKAPEGMFGAEDRGLRLLASAGTVRVPDVVMVSERVGEVPAFLVLEWVELAGEKSEEAAAKLGETLALLHKHVAPRHGLGEDNFIGWLPQTNSQSESWAGFFGQQRIRPQMELARETRQLTGGLEEKLGRLIEKLPELLPDVQASLLHGDLWGGNWGAPRVGGAVVFDPAAYYGHREVDLAMSELFGGFPGRFYEAYNSVWPLEAGYEERRGLYQLYYLLVHMNMFGGSYAGQVERVVDRYVS